MDAARRFVAFWCLSLMVLTPAIVVAQGQQSPSSPCEDEVYIGLKQKGLNDMSPREYEYFDRKDKECAEFRRLITSRPVAEQAAQPPVATPQFAAPVQIQPVPISLQQVTPQDRGMGSGTVIAISILGTIAALVVIGALAGS